LCFRSIATDKKVVGVFVRVFRAPFTGNLYGCHTIPAAAGCQQLAHQRVNRPCPYWRKTFLWRGREDSINLSIRLPQFHSLIWYWAGTMAMPDKCGNILVCNSRWFRYFTGTICFRQINIYLCTKLPNGNLQSIVIRWR
jgi:hypothetical protein